MRADRLLSLLMILQARGKVTAQELAAELEVSERTIYRDVIALSTSGVPIYAERGPGGGIRLVEEYRSNLTGLTRDEVRALFMVSIPEPLAQLGFDQELRAVLLKLSAALPSSLRGDEELARQRIHIDPEPWDRDRRSVSVPFLPAVQRAVWEGRVLQVRYQLVAGPQIDSLAARLHPLGLVAKGGEWYLVARREDHVSVLPVDSLIEVEILDEIFYPPGDFNLAAFWDEWCWGQSLFHRAFVVLMRVRPDLESYLRVLLGEGAEAVGTQSGESAPMDWITYEARFGSHEEARTKLLGFGSAIEVIDPPALRYSLKDYAEQILAVYS
jgi:predicted DNA-binding transcriptional regulator YafY